MQNTTQETKYWATRTPLISRVNSCATKEWTYSVHKWLHTHMQVMLEYIYRNLTGICDKFRYHNRPHYQFIGKGMTHIEIYLWYPLITVQWNRCDQHSRLTFIYLLKWTRLNSGMWNVRTWSVSPIFLENTLHEVCLIPIPDFRKSALPFLMRVIFSLETV